MFTYVVDEVIEFFRLTLSFQFTKKVENEVFVSLKKQKKDSVPRVLLSYMSTWEFLRTLEKCEKHSLAASASLALLSCS